MHTPGPWTYDESTNEIFSLTGEHGSGWIAVIGGNDSNNVPYAEETKTANAQLISAAPDLLSAAKLLVALEENDVNPADTRWKQARKDLRLAIAKAERGE